MENIVIRSDTKYLYTIGLKSTNGHEIQLLSNGNIESEEALLFFLANYILSSNVLVKSGQTVSYGLWLLKFYLKDDILYIYELDPTFTDWLEGAANALYYYEQQRELCKGENAELSIPLFTQYIAISKGVLEGLNVQGIRYLEPDHMSGWYLTSNEYDKNIKNLRVIPLQELVIARKDLLQFLGLPPRYVFETMDEQKCRIWQLPEIGENISGN